jgi:plastocyanin
MERKEASMKRALTIMVAALLVFAAAGCDTDQARDTAGDVADEAEDVARDAADEAQDAADRAEDVVNDRTVDIDNFAYEPKTLTVTRGTEVTWVNRDDVPHTVTSDEGEALDSGNLTEGKEFSERFLEDGTFEYHCEVHGKDRMSGTIVVEEG